LGDGTSIDKNIPTQIGTANNWLSISTGRSFSSAIKTDGTLYTWGNNVLGQLGNGTTTPRNIPTAIGCPGGIPAPTMTITSFTPTSASVGTTITITGTNFTGATAVSFGGVAATSFAVVNATTITAVLGSGASGSVSVTTPGGTSSLAGFTYTSILPLSVISFTTQIQNNTTNLSWQTNNEVNVSHFIIQRSEDGTSFSNIGKVVAKGDGTYNYTDNQLLNATIIYYRLQMVDKDGSYTYSKVEAVTLNDKRKTLTMYPNPVKDNLFVQFTSSKAEKLTLQVTDLQGRILQQEDTQVGIANVSLSVNTSALAKGSYVLLVKSSKGLQQKQFVKE
jgi:hypothetical protein